MSDIIPSPLNPSGAPLDDGKARGAERVAICDLIQWLDRLVKSEDFAKYQGFIAGGIAHCEAQASDITKNDAATRDAWAQRFFGMRSLHDWPETQLAAARAQLQALDANAR